MIKFTRMRPVQRQAPFDHPDYIFELKHDGFGALLHLRHGHAWFESKNGNRFHQVQFTDLAASAARSLKGRDMVLDGEIVCLDPDGHSNFQALMRREGMPYFYAYDLLAIDGKDLRSLPLLERKRRLKRLLPRPAGRVLYLDHIRQHGRAFFKVVCQHDLEGMVAKWGKGTYDPNKTRPWVKIKNPAYSQKEGRGELFERGRKAS